MSRKHLNHLRGFFYFYSVQIAFLCQGYKFTISAFKAFKHLLKFKRGENKNNEAAHWFHQRKIKALLNMAHATKQSQTHHEQSAKRVAA